MSYEAKMMEMKKLLKKKTSATDAVTSQEAYNPSVSSV